MKNLTKEVHSLRDFERNAAELARRIKRTGRPLVLAIDNKAKLVVQDAASYERMLQQIDKLEAIEGIRKGLEDVKHGRFQPAKEAFEEIRRKHKIPRSK